MIQKRELGKEKENQKQFKQTLKGFCEIYQQYNQEGKKCIVQQPFVSKFCLTLIEYSESDKTDDPSDIDQPGYIGLDLTRKLRTVLMDNTSNFDYNFPFDEYSFYIALLEKVTQNLNNLVTVPRRLQSFLMREGYKKRRTDGDLSQDTVFQSVQHVLSPKTRMSPISASGKDKLVVLRRWQSYNPRIPRPIGEMVRGGGYFLFWQGKGIVIDPGYDFITNFYAEGFTLSDLNAVIITHSHPDHDDDLSTLTTLIVEWNEFHRSMGYDKEHIVRLDVFLNESSHMKFSAWLKATGDGIGKILLMPLVVWNMNSEKVKSENEDPKKKAIRGEDVVLSVLYEYNIKLEIVPAWHDDVIGSTSAVGLKFHLFFQGEYTKPVGIIGYTGDTGVYEYSLAEKVESTADKYKECDILN